MNYELLGKIAEEAQENPAREPISDVVAGRHDEALAKLRELLTRCGMRSQVVEWLKLTLRSSTFPRQSTSSLVRYPPELLVFSPQGRRVATVRMAPRSDAYIVEVVQEGKDNAVSPDRMTLVPGDSPDRAAALIPGYSRHAMNCEDLEARYGREWHIYPLRWGTAAVRKRVPTPEQFAQGYLYALIGANPDDLASQLDQQPDRRIPTQRPL